MASLGLIAKAVENLRSLQLHETLNPDHEVKKKEKIANCLALTNSISLANVKAAPQVLNLSIETLICLCDDPDPDVRIMADECLNKIIRAVADSYVLKIQSELYREIGRNGAARCLRAALSRFGLLSHMIRPVRAKYFASQLTPCIVEIAKRKEDIVIEVLSQSLPLILKTLGHYVPDKDIRILLTTFFQNLTSTESVFRRASANMILTTCLNSRKPQHFLNHVIEQLIDTLSQSSQAFGESRNQEDKHINAVLGAFGCLRLLFPQIDSSSALCKEFSDEQLIEHYIGVYELSLHYTNLHVSHNVTNAALEVLSELLNNPPKCVIAILTSSEGLGQRGHKLRERIRQWSSVPSLAAASVASNDDQLESSPNFLESDFIDMPEIAPKVEKWMTEMPDVGSAVEGKSKDSIQIIDTKDLGDYSGLMIGSLDTEDAEVESNASSDVSRLERSIEPNPLSFTGMNEPDDDAAVKEEEEQMELEGEESSGLAEDSTPDQIAQRRLLKLNIGGPRDREVALRYCCRQLGSSFLLDGSAPGQLLPDKLIRVSVKSLTLTCLGRALRLYPEMLFESLVKYNIETCNEQKLTDVLMLAEHSDPQIRGNVMLLIGSFLQGALALKHSSSALSTTEAVLTTENLVKLIVKGLKDESATTSRHTLSALGIFLPSLLESEESVCAKPILKALPGLSRNPYFLVKIKLVEILSELPYGSIEYVNPELKFQERVIEVLLSLLGDADQRVRRAAGNAITRIIPRLHYEGPGEDAVTRKAGRYVEQYICSAIPDPSVFLDAGGQVEYRLLLDSLMRPYQALFKRPSERARARVVDEALSRILGLLAECFLVQSNRYLSQGACEALSLLSETYLTSVHPRAWDCPTRLLVRQTRRHTKLPTSKMENPEQFAGLSNKPLTALSSSLFSHTVILLSSSALSLDLSAHRHLLQLAGNLAAGIACSSCRSKDQAPGPSSANDSAKADAEPTDDFKYWLLFADKSNARNMEKLLVHVMRVLNIFQHVIEDLPSPLQPASKSALPSLTAAHSLSPKRKLLSSSQSSKSKVSATDKSSESHHRLTFRFGGKEQFGSLAGQSHYLRLYELLRAAHSSYRVTLDQEASELYLGLLNATLQVLSQILEMASLNETGRIAEEMLHYLQSTVLLSSTGTVHCVRQLLKSLFGTNLIARWTEVYGAQCRREAREGQTRDEDELGWPEEEARQGFYEQCFQRPARLMSEAIKSTSRNCRGGNEPDTEYRLVGSLQRKEERKISSIMKILSRNTDQNSVSSFIRLFEPLVIKSLIQYTISNSVALQCQVLMLLSQLIHLHINYCLMDSDKIFIGFVMKQFEFIEEGHIAEAKLLLPKIFDFLVRLSYEKYHSKLIIGVPKIIQLCDGLMASGQPPLTHCIPALAPIVEELFLARTTPASLNEEKELETTREVLVSMMLRLAEYPQIVDLLARCLMESRSSADGNGEEKWRRWSRQTVDTVLSMLSTRKLRLESRKAYFALVKLFSSVSPTVFRPVDPLLRVLFTLPPYVGKNLISKNLMDFKRWIGMVNVIILSLVAFAKEEVMLGRLSEVSATIADLPEILLIPDSCRRSSGDPLNVSGRLEPFSMAPDMILARFIFRAIGALSSVVLEFLQV